MEIKIYIDDEKISNFTRDAVHVLKKETEKYTTEIIKETILIEEGLHEDETESDITGSHVKQAVRKNRIVSPKKKSKVRMVINYVIKIISYVLSLIAGGLFDIEAMKLSTDRLVWCMIVFAGAIITTTLQFIGEERE